MGVLVRERNGAWWVLIHHGKKRKAKKIGPGKEGKAAAKAVAAKIQAGLVLGDVGILDPKEPAKKVPTFKDVAADWERVTAPNWKQGTKITYGNALRCRLLPTFGGLPITDLTPDRVEDWWTGCREEGLSRKYLVVLRCVLRGVCRRAMRLGLITFDPADYIDGHLGREDAEIRKTDYLTPEDLTRFLEVAERVAPMEHPIFLVMATAGLRIGEACGLQVGDLDAPALQVHIRRTVRRAYITSPKSGKADVVDVPATTMAVLAELKEIRQAEAAVEGTEARWLFPGKAPGLPITPEAVQRILARVLKAASLRHIKPHSLRHGYATLAVQAGVPLLTVSRQLRHASISTTANLYVHAVPGSNRAAAEVFETILTRNQTQPPRN